VFSGEEIYPFPDPIGPCTVVYHVHEEIFTLPYFIKGLKKVNMKVGWQPTLFIAKALTELGLFSEKPIEVDGVKVAPRKLFFKLTKSIPTTDELVKKIEAGVVLETVMTDVIEVKGEKAGVEITFKYLHATPRMTLREGYKKYGRSFLERPGIVGTSCAIFTYMLGSERIKTKGVVPPEGLTREERDVFLKELTERGFVYKEIVERNLS
jgi:saccharopine dehydrogenase-like NADP-dependent oxidoreductase